MTDFKAAIDDVEIGDRLKRARLAAGLTLQEVGSSVGLTYQQIRKYELGENRIAASRLIHVARVLGKSPSYFMPTTEAADDPAIVGEEETRVARRLAALSDEMRAPMLRSFSAALDALESHGHMRRASI